MKTRLRYQSERVTGSNLEVKSCEDTITLPKRACRESRYTSKSFEDTITLPERASLKGGYKQGVVKAKSSYKQEL